MSHEWNRGQLNKSSWHGLEEVGAMLGAVEMIEAGERTGAWPLEIAKEGLKTSTGLDVGELAVVGSYRHGYRKPLGIVSNLFRPTEPGEWRELVHAAVKAGGKPTGAFSLGKGERVLGTFEVGMSKGIRTNLLLVDSFDGASALTGGFTSVRVVCANTLALSIGRDGRSGRDGSGMARLRHCSTLGEKVKLLGESFDAAAKSGESVRKMYEDAEKATLSKPEFTTLFDALFPEAPEDAAPSAKTLAENKRKDAHRVAQLPVNFSGPTVATLWNAATYLVDRTGDGDAKKMSRGNSLDSMVFGSRGKRVQTIERLIEVIMRDGKIETMSQTEALRSGASDAAGSLVDEIAEEMDAQ